MNTLLLDTFQCTIARIGKRCWK